MTKYNEEFKLMVVQEYLSGSLGYRAIAKKYGVGATPLRKWVRAYKEFGYSGLSVKKTKRFYSVQFKLDVLSYMKRTGASHQDTAIHFNLNDPTLVANTWVRTLRQNRIFQSMSRKATCADNAAMENFFSLLKQEMYYGEQLISCETLQKKIKEYINYYNNVRIKQKLAGMSPVNYRKHGSQSCIIKTLTLRGHYLLQ